MNTRIGSKQTIPVEGNVTITRATFQHMLDLLGYVIADDPREEMADEAETVLLRAVAEAGWQHQTSATAES